MTLHPRFAEAFKHLHPSADLRHDIVVMDHGRGPELAAWNLPGAPPSDQQILDALAEADAAARRRPVVSYAEFRARWTDDELAALFAAEPADWRVRDVVQLAAARNEIDLAGATAAAARALFVARGILTAERAEIVFAIETRKE